MTEGTEKPKRPYNRKPPAVSAPLVLTPVEAGVALSVTRTTIWRLIKSGAIKSVKVGNIVRIPVSEIERILAA